MVGIYGSAPTCYLSMLARIDGFTRADLDTALYRDRSLVRVRAMRYSVHMLPHDLLPVVYGALSEVNVKGVRGNLGRVIDLAEAPAWCERVLAVIDQPMVMADIRQALGVSGADADIVKRTVSYCAAQGLVVRSTVSGTWRSDRHSYARWSDWLPAVDPHALSPEVARAELARRYIEAYGPVTYADFRWWSGLPARAAKQALTDLGHDPKAPSFGGPRTLPDGVRLLPLWDSLLVGYTRRDHLVDAADIDRVYDHMGNATSVVLVDGRVQGIWDLGLKDDPLRVKVAPFRTFDAKTWRAVEGQVERIAALAGASRFDIIRCDPPPVLKTAPKNTFKSPLSTLGNTRRG